jgi:ribosomal protein L12E/L44/L45/RPP1/RPP2
MDIDPKDLIDTAQAAREQREARSARLNAVVAITVAVLATFMGICKVKDDNIVQAMQQAQADKLDHWAFYQARNLRQEVAEATVTQLELAAPSAAAASAVAKYRALAQEQAKKKDELRAQAEQDQKNYDALNYRDDQFDLSDALIAIAIAMLAVTALTQLWPLYWAALVPTGFGVLMGVAGLAGLPIHPETLVKLLS